MGDVETIQVRGSGGATFTMDVPTPGSRKEELLLEQLRKGDLFLLDDEGHVVPYVEEPDATDIPAESSAGGDEVSAELPPKAGPGSSREAWAEFAEGQGIDINEDMNRDEIMTAVEEHLAAQA